MTATFAIQEHHAQLQKIFTAMRHVRVSADTNDCNVELIPALAARLSGSSLENGGGISFFLSVPGQTADEAVGYQTDGSSPERPPDELWVGCKNTGEILRLVQSPESISKVNEKQCATRTGAPQWALAGIIAPLAGCVPMCAVHVPNIDARFWPFPTDPGPLSGIAVGYSSGKVVWFLQKVLPRAQDETCEPLASLHQQVFLEKYSALVSTPPAVHGACTAVLSVQVAVESNETAMRDSAHLDSLVFAGFDSGAVLYLTPQACRPAWPTTHVAAAASTVSDDPFPAATSPGRVPNLRWNAVSWIGSNQQFLPHPVHFDSSVKGPHLDDIIFFVVKRDGTVVRFVLPWSAKAIAAFQKGETQGHPTDAFGCTMYTHSRRANTPPKKGRNPSPGQPSRVQFAGATILPTPIPVATLRAHHAAQTEVPFVGLTVWVALNHVDMNCGSNAYPGSYNILGCSVIGIDDSPDLLGGVVNFPLRSIPVHTLCGRVAVGDGIGGQHDRLPHPHGFKNIDVAGNYLSIASMRNVGDVLWLMTRKPVSNAKNVTGKTTPRNRSPRTSPTRHVTPQRRQRSSEQNASTMITESFVILSSSTLQPVPIRDSMGKFQKAIEGTGLTLDILCPVRHAVSRVWVATTTGQLNVLRFDHQEEVSPSLVSEIIACRPTRKHSLSAVARHAQSLQSLEESVMRLRTAVPPVPDEELVRKAAAAPRWRAIFSAYREHLALWLQYRNEMVHTRWRLFGWIARLQRRRIRFKLWKRESIATEYIVKSQYNHLKWRLAVWANETKRAVKNRRLITRCASLVNWKFVLRKEYMKKWLCWRRKIVSSRVLPRLLHKTSHGCLFNAWQHWIWCIKARREQRRKEDMAELLTRLNGNGGASRLLQQRFWRRWVQRAHVTLHRRTQTEALEAMTQSLGGRMSRIALRGYYRRWIGFEKMRKSTRRTRQLATAMATSTDSSRRLASFNRWREWARQHVHKRRKNRAVCERLGAQTHLTHSALSFQRWIGFLHVRHEQRSREQAESIVLSMIKSSNRGLLFLYFRKWKKYADSQRPSVQGSAGSLLLRQTEIGLRKTYFRKWFVYSRGLSKKKKLLNAAGALLAGSGRGLRQLCYRRWFAFAGTARKHRRRTKLMVTFSRSTDSLLLRLYYVKWRGFSKLKLRRLKQVSASFKLKEKAERRLVRGFWRRWSGYVILKVTKQTREMERASKFEVRTQAEREVEIEAECESLKEEYEKLYRRECEANKLQHEAEQLEADNQVREAALNAQRQLLQLESELLDERIGEKAAVSKLLVNNRRLLRMAKHQLEHFEAAEKDIETLIEQVTQEQAKTREKFNAIRKFQLEEEAHRRQNLARLPLEKGKVSRPSFESLVAPKTTTSRVSGTVSYNTSLMPGVSVAPLPTLTEESRTAPSTARVPILRTPAVPRAVAHSSVARTDSLRLPSPKRTAARVGATSRPRTPTARLQDEEVTVNRSSILRQIEAARESLAKGRLHLEAELAVKVKPSDRLMNNISGAVHKKYNSPARILQ